MFGLEALVGSAVVPLLPYLLGALAVLGGVFYLKTTGRAEGKDAARREQQAARQAQQDRVDAARRDDAAIDRATAEAVRKAQQPPPPDPPVQPGDVFKFVWILLLVPLLAGCPKVPPASPVYVDVPPAPLLAPCPDAPHPAGTAEARQGTTVVVLALEDAQRIRDYLRAAPGCWAAREAQLRGHLEKLERRLRAVAP